jgi:hypothetical protein
LRKIESLRDAHTALRVERRAEHGAARTIPAKRLFSLGRRARRRGTARPTSAQTARVRHKRARATVCSAVDIEALLI